MRRLALAALLLSPFVVPALARAEILPGSAGASDSLLATAADGSPRVAFVAPDGSIVAAGRDAAGTWVSQAVPVPRLTAPALVGLASARSGLVLLVEASDGSRLVLAEQRGSIWTVRTVASRPKNGLLGFGGLALAADGRPLVAYATLFKSHTTTLRLVHEDTHGRLVGEAVTRKGFPKSADLPTVTPVVLANGAVHVLEAYSGQTIEWSRTRNGKDWAGQFLFANSLAEPAGIVRALANPAGGAWSAWTELYPNYGESHVVLSPNPNGQRSVVLTKHAFLVGLAETTSGPEVAADDYVDLGGGHTVYAGEILDAAGNVLELAGNLEGYAVESTGARQYLLLGADGVEWYRSPTAPAARVTLSATVDGAAFALSGSVSGATGGTIEIERETGAGTEAVATLPLAADGTFTFLDTPTTRPLTYRAVYHDASGVPVAALVRTVLGA